MKDILIRLFSKLLYVLLESLKVIIKFILIPAIFLTILRNTNIESWVLKHPIAVCSISVGCSVLGLGISFLCTKKEISSRPLQFLSYILRGCGELGIGFAIAEFYIIPKIYELSVVETVPESIPADNSKLEPIVIAYLVFMVLVVLAVLWRTIVEDGLLVFGIVLCIGVVIAFTCFAVTSSINRSLDSATTQIESQSAEEETSADSFSNSTIA
jgi:dipeptide/tripeptide permease